MLNSLKKLFPNTITDDSDQKERSLHLSAAVLMIEVLSADNIIDQREIKHTLALLAARFNLPENALSQLFESARKKQEDAISLQGFTREICDQFNNLERLQLLSMLWEIALIDNDLDSNERHLIRKIASLLYLNDKQIIQAKEMAKLALKEFP